MADEVLGNVYEIITEIAVRNYSSICLPGETVFAQGKPLGAGIIPDITVGSDVDNPRILLQVHHTLAERASELKFWRNIGEYVDARLVLGAQTRIMTLAFYSRGKKRLSVATQNLMDGYLEIDEESHGFALQEFAKDLAKAFIKNKTPEANRLSEAKKALAGDKVTIGAITQLASEIENQLTSASQAGANWFQTYQQVQATRGIPRIPTRKLTTLRRALGRFLPIDDESHLRRLLISVRNQTKADWPEFLLQVNVAQKVIGGSRFSRPSVSGKKLESHPSHEIWCMTQLLSDDDIVALWDGMRNATASLQQACASIRASNEFGVFHAFVVKHFNTLTTPNGLKNALLDCFKDPGFVLGEKLAIKNPSERGVWLFEYLMTIIKAETGKQQGYGYTNLARDAKVLVPGKRSILDFALPKLINRTEFLPKGVDIKTSGAISTKLKNVGDFWISKNQATISNFSLKGAFEDKIYKTASFNPLLFLINNALAGSSITRTKRHPTFLSSFMAKGAATCDVLQIGNYAIMTQAAFAGGVEHKGKELVGRVGMLRVERSSSGTTQPAPYEKIFLVIDGTWTQDQIARLARAGFDGIYYPDELDQLAAEITS